MSSSLHSYPFLYKCGALILTGLVIERHVMPYETRIITDKEIYHAESTNFILFNRGSLFFYPEHRRVCKIHTYGFYRFQYELQNRTRT